MEKVKKEGKEWKNHKGDVFPAKVVSGYDKRKEKVMVKLLKQADKCNQVLAELKKQMFEGADDLEVQMYKAYSMEKPVEAKGNMTFYSFDKSIRFTMKVQDVIEFDDKIQMAQLKINEFLAKKSEGADQDLMLIVNNAFKTTKGRLDKSRIFSLFGLSIKDQTWTEAIELIKASITTNHTRRYASIAKRDADGNYVDVNLNISSI